MAVKIYRSFLAGGMLLGFLFADSTAEIGEAYYGFVEEPVNTRLMGMGSVGTAIGGGGFSFYNPASPALYRPSVALDFGKLYEDLRRGNIEIRYNFDTWFIGGALQNQTIDFQFSNDQGVIEGVTGTEQGTMASLTVGLIRNNFALGIALNGIDDRIVQEKSLGVTASAGILYSLIPEKLQLGASVLHFAGRGTVHSDTTRNLKKLVLPTTVRAGVSYRDSLKGKMVYTAAADLVYSFNLHKVMVPLGMEFQVLPPLAIRLGVRLNQPVDIFTMGIGLKFENLKYDVAFIPMKLQDDVSVKWTMGLTYELAQPKKMSPKKVDGADKNDSVVIKDTAKTKTGLSPVKTSDDNSILEESDTNTPLDTLQSSGTQAQIPVEGVQGISQESSSLPEVNNSKKDETQGNPVNSEGEPEAVPADTTSGSKPQ